MPTGPQRWKEGPATPSGYVNQTRQCNWCGGSGHDPHFGGESETCQTCAGSGVEERYVKKGSA